MKLWCLLAILPALHAQNSHVIPLTDLHREAQAVARERKENLAKLDRFLSSGGASTALKAMNVKNEQVHHAVALLSDSEIAALSERAPEPKPKAAKQASPDRKRLYYIAGASAGALTLILLLK